MSVTQTTGVQFDAMESVDEQERGSKSVLFGILAILLLSPVTFRLFCHKPGSAFSDFLICSITMLLAGLMIFIANKILRQREQLVDDPEKSSKSNIFNVFTTSARESYMSLKEKHNRNKAKIDPKYFKPKYIFNELMSIWGTTYTVITWGSVWVVGGTIVATERLAQKIKTKCTKDQTSNQKFRRNNSFTSYSSYDFNSSTSSEPAAQAKAKTPLRRFASWTRRTCSSTKRKFTKFVGTGLPQITSSDQNVH